MLLRTQFLLLTTVLRTCVKVKVPSDDTFFPPRRPAVDLLALRVLPGPPLVLPARPRLLPRNHEPATALVRRDGLVSHGRERHLAVRRTDR